MVNIEFNNLVQNAKKETLGECVDFYCFGDTPLLIIVPHAGGQNLDLTVGGKKIKINLEESGTDVLAALAASSVGGSLLISRVSRDVADFARDPELMGTQIYARLGHPKVKDFFKVLVHKDKTKRSLLQSFHKKIEDFNPRFMLTYHGMYNKRFDALLGFGKQKQYIGGKTAAFKFSKKVNDELGNVKLSVGVSLLKLTGESEFNLNSHVTGSMKGVLVEFNKAGRPKSGPTQDYRKLAVSIAKVAEEWIE